MPRMSPPFYDGILFDRSYERRASENAEGRESAMTKNKIKVYISGPLTTGNLIDNVRRAAKAAGILLDKGFAIYLPHVNVFWELVHAAPYETWIDNDFAWLDVCAVFLRLPGVSDGADREQQRFIKQNGASRVYLSLETLLACERP